MPEVNTQTVHDVSLTQGDVDRLGDGATFEIELSDGSTLKLSGPGEDGGSPGKNMVQQVQEGASAEEVAENRDDVTEDDVKDLVKEARQESGNPSMIEKNPDQPDNVEQV